MSTPQIYEGLSNRSKTWIIIISASIAIANISMAWFEAHRALSSLEISRDNIEHINSTSKGLENSDIRANEFQLRTHALNTLVHIKGIKNKQSIVIISIGSGFALIAIGFSLFLLGADGALKISFERGGDNNRARGINYGADDETNSSTDIDTKFMLIATTPGLACFVLAALLIAFGLSREYTFKIGDSQYIESMQHSLDKNKKLEGSSDKEPSQNIIEIPDP